jgi:hypothetical protein
LLAPVPPEARRLRGRIAAATRHHPGDTATIANDKRQYRYLVLEDYIKRTVDAAPPLTPAMRHQLALLLRGGDAA